MPPERGELWWTEQQQMPRVILNAGYCKAISTKDWRTRNSGAQAGSNLNSNTVDITDHQSSGYKSGRNISGQNVCWVENSKPWHPKSSQTSNALWQLQQLNLWRCHPSRGEALHYLSFIKPVGYIYTQMSVMTIRCTDRGGTVHLFSTSTFGDCDLR